MKLFRSVSVPCSPALTLVMSAYAIAALATGQQAQKIALPAGISIPVRTVDRITSAGVPSPMEYRATVDDSIVSGAVTLVSLGTPAFLRVVEVQQAGAVRGRAGVSVRLVALEVDGQRIEFQTGDAKIEGNSQAKRATKAGILAGLIGAGVGAATGGAQGAAEGALLGTGIGITAAALSGQTVQVPPETRLSFTLTGSSTAAVVTATDAALLADLMTIQRQGAKAAIAGDRAAVEALLDTTFVATLNGKTVSRLDYLKMVKPQPSIVSSDFENPQLQTGSEGPSMTGYYVIQQTQRGKVKSARQKFRDTFVQRDGKWLVRSSEVVVQ